MRRWIVMLAWCAATGVALAAVALAAVTRDGMRVCAAVVALAWFADRWAASIDALEDDHV